MRQTITTVEVMIVWMMSLIIRLLPLPMRSICRIGIQGSSLLRRLNRSGGSIQCKCKLHSFVLSLDKSQNIITIENLWHRY